METAPYTHSGNTTNLLVFLRAEVESLDKPTIHKCNCGTMCCSENKISIANSPFKPTY